MSKGMNKAIIEGNLVRDPELKKANNGKSFINFTLAVSDDYKNQKGEVVKQTDFVNCTAWGTAAEVISKYTAKGKPLLIEGKIKTRTYEKNGEKKYSTEVSVSELYLLSYHKDKPETQPLSESLDDYGSTF